MSDDTRETATTDTHQPARPMKYFKDKDGNGWLCDKDIDPDADLEAQGCRRCEDMACSPRVVVSREALHHGAHRERKPP
jgi:hypothetical protein